MCCCCCGKGKKCCCCGKRGAAITFSLLGLVLAGSIIAFPVYIYKTDQNYNKMFPVLTFGRNYLAKLADYDGEQKVLNGKPDVVKDDNPEDKDEVDIEDHEKIYKLAIFQLLDDIEEKNRYFSFYIILSWMYKCSFILVFINWFNVSKILPIIILANFCSSGTPVHRYSNDYFHWYHLFVSRLPTSIVCFGISPLGHCLILFYLHILIMDHCVQMLL